MDLGRFELSVDIWWVTKLLYQHALPVNCESAWVNVASKFSCAMHVLV
jgi:hypothetical protein